MSSKKNLIHIRKENTGLDDGICFGHDEHERYQMEAVRITHQKVHKKMMTVLLNIDVIATSESYGLNRDVVILRKYLGYYFSADTCEDQNSHHYINKILTVDDIQGAIYEFIDTFVICKECSAVDTQIIITKKKKTKVCTIKCQTSGCSVKLDADTCTTPESKTIKQLCNR